MGEACEGRPSYCTFRGSQWPLLWSSLGQTLHHVLHMADSQGFTVFSHQNVFCPQALMTILWAKYSACSVECYEFGLLEFWLLLYTKLTMENMRQAQKLWGYRSHSTGSTVLVRPTNSYSRSFQIFLKRTWSKVCQVLPTKKCVNVCKLCIYLLRVCRVREANQSQLQFSFKN